MSDKPLYYCRVKLRDRKAMAALMAIRSAAESIQADQPWNEDAKQIERLAARLLRRIEVRRQK